MSLEVAQMDLLPADLEREGDPERRTRGRASRSRVNCQRSAIKERTARSRYGSMLPESVLPEFDCRYRPFSIMTFDRNPEPVEFIQADVVHCARLSVGENDGFADQFRLRLAILGQDPQRTAFNRWH